MRLLIGMGLTMSGTTLIFAFAIIIVPFVAQTRRPGKTTASSGTALMARQNNSM